jgi:HSP20 family protein
MFENFFKGFPSGKEFSDADWFREPFDEMIKRFEESMPPESEELFREERTPSGVIRRYGPVVYGFS